MKNKYIHQIVLIITVIVLWESLHLRMNNSILLPSFFEVLKTMFSQLQQSSFYIAIFLTLQRVTIGLLMSALVALVLAMISLQSKVVDYYVNPLVGAIKSIPNISFMIIILLWFGSETSVFVVIFFVVFPIFYYSIKAGFSTIDPHLKDVLLLYPLTKVDELKDVYLPLSIAHLQSALSSGIGLALKVGIMAEILGQVSKGVGKSMYIGKINLEMHIIFAWTLWIIIIIYIVEKGVNGYFKKIQK